MCTKIELNTILSKVYDIYHAVYGKDIFKILLYGSYARGDYTEDSDIDIVAIVHGERANIQEKLKDIWDVSSDLELEYEIIISPTVIPYDEFIQHRNDLPYYKNIANEGIELHDQEN